MNFAHMVCSNMELLLRLEKCVELIIYSSFVSDQTIDGGFKVVYQVC